MISYFPIFYDDELLYSLFSRYYQKTGYTTYRDAAQDLFKNMAVRPDIEFMNQLTDDALNRVKKIKPIEQVILENTMYAYYGRFLKSDRRNNAYESLVNMTGNHRNFLLMRNNIGNGRYLRYCPLCSKEHRELYGETYWMRRHQCSDIRLCYKHNCLLKNSNVKISGKESPSLDAAELIIPANEEPEYNQNDLEYEFTRYVIDLFVAPIDFDNNVAIGSFLHNKLAGTSYLSSRGEARKITRLYDDFMEYYKFIDISIITESWQLQKVFTGYRCNLADIAQLAFFLKVPIDEMIHPKITKMCLSEQFDAKIKKMHDSGMNYGEIARCLDASYDVVKSVGEGRYKKKYPKKTEPSKQGVKCYDWKVIDESLLPDVKKAVEEIYGNPMERPHRVTVFGVSKRLKLPDKYLEHLHLCMAVIKERYETYEEYFAREAVWAVKKIMKEGGTLNYTGVRKLTNMRRVHFESCFMYLEKFTDCEMADIIRKM